MLCTHRFWVRVPVPPQNLDCYKKNVVFLDISYFDDLYTKSLEEFSIEEKLDNLLALYSYIKNAKMTYRVPISNKFVGFRLRSLNRFVYKINNFI